MLIDVQGIAGEVKQSVPIDTLGVNNTIRVKYFHFPELPLLDKFVNAVTVAGVAVDVNAANSIAEIVNQLDALEQGGNRVCYVWYNSNEFELCVGTQTITLSAEFAAVFKLPTTLTANTCYSSSVFESQIGMYSHYAVQIAHARGHWSDGGYDNVIAKIRRGAAGDCDVSSTNAHFFKAPVHVLELSIAAVKRDGTSVRYYAPEVYGIGLEIV
jgi:hypothetical protein